MSQYAKDIIDISDRLFRYAEPAATLVTGAAAEPLSGLYGLANLAITRNPDAAANAVNQAQRALTYQPRTAQGQAGLRGLQDILQPIGEVVQGASQNLGDKAYGATGSPALAAAAYSAPTAMLEALGLKGLSIARKPVGAADLYTPRMSAGSFGKIQNFRAPDFELDPSELADVGAEVADGMVTLYHRTTPEAAEKIRKSGKFETKEDGVFFSTSLDGQAKDYGEGIVKVKVPSSMLQLDDIFDNEAHVRVPMNKAGAIDLKRFIANDEQPKASSALDISEKFKQSGVSSSISERPSQLVLNKVIVPQESRGSGIGSAFMKELIDYGNSSGKPIALTPSSDFGGNKSRLIEFYKRFGFVENKGKNKDYEISESMYKLPDGK